jgi:hypothetical protein
MAICDFCGDLFTPNGRGKHRFSQRFCSIGCGLRGAKPSRTVVCCECDRKFVYHGRGGCKRCPQCRDRVTRIRSAAWQRRHDTEKPGVGRGGNQWGFKNHQYKDGKHTGISGYRRLCFKIYPKECLLCGKSAGVIDAHHIDGDKRNNTKSNLVPLCRSHHKEVHWAIDATKEQMIAAFNKVKRRTKKCVM